MYLNKVHGEPPFKNKTKNKTKNVGATKRRNLAAEGKKVNMTGGIRQGC